MPRSDPTRVLLTGPVNGRERWSQALASAESLEVIERPVLEIVSLTLPAVGERPDWLCLTSSNALPALERCWKDLRGVPVAVVGGTSAEIARAWGLEVEVGPAASSDELLAQWRDRLEPGQRVLWPRGSVSDDLARDLRALGLIVDDPIAYDTRESRDRRALPAADFVFFASPSAVRAAAGLERVDPSAPVAIAIGPTTARALAEDSRDDPALFAGLEVLERPEPEALVQLLAELERRKLRGH